MILYVLKEKQNFFYFLIFIFSPPDQIIFFSASFSKSVFVISKKKKKKLMPPAAVGVKVKHSLQGFMVQYEDRFSAARWTEIDFPADTTFGGYTKLMAKNLEKLGHSSDSNLFLFIKPGGSSAGFTPTPDQTLGDLFTLFKTNDGALIVDVAAQPMFG